MPFLASKMLRCPAKNDYDCENIPTQSVDEPINNVRSNASGQVPRLTNVNCTAGEIPPGNVNMNILHIEKKDIVHTTRVPPSLPQR